MRIAMLALLLSGVAAPVLAQSGDPSSLPARVDRIEKELHAVQRKVFPGSSGQYFEPQITAPDAAPPAEGAPASSAVSDLTQRVSALERQIQEVTNQSEQNDHRLQVLEQTVAKSQGDTDYRLSALEKGGAPAQPVAAPFGPAGRKPSPSPPKLETSDVSGAPASPAAATAPPPAPVPTPVPVAKTGDPAEDMYMAGYALWMQKRYGEAEDQLKQVVAQYPEHKRASYAQNLLGRAYMDDGQFTSAADAFLTSYKKFPRGDRAPDSLYYLGVTLTKLKKTTQACQVFDELRDVYGATMPAPLKARMAQGRADARCGA